MRRLSITIAALIAAAGVAAVRPDVARAQDNAAVAVNTKDGTSIFRLAFKIQRVAGDVVDNGNGAVAFASCTECRTVAIAIQVVLVTGDPEVVTPTNLALAYNLECTACETLASAYQFVFGTDGAQVHFTADGNRELAQLRHELRELRQSELPVGELQAKIDALMERLATVLRTELELAGKSGTVPRPEDTPPPQTTAGTTTAPPPTEQVPTEPALTDTTTTTTTTETIETTTP